MREERIKLFSKTTFHDGNIRKDSSVILAVDFKLYRYRSLDTPIDMENAVKTICENKLFFPCPLNFNDPFDSRPNIGIIIPQTVWEDSLRRVGETIEGFDAEKLKNAKIYSEERKLRYIKFGKAQDSELKKIGICSFSEEGGIILMWSHYSNSHKGYCLEFDPKANQNFFSEVESVTYQDEDYPFINIPDAVGQGITNPDVRKAFFIKYTQWQHEKRISNL